MISYKIREANEMEQNFSYSQEKPLMARLGCIGHLRADMDTDGTGFFTSWTNNCDELKTQGFKDELDELINELRFGEEWNFLKNRTELGRFCDAHEDAKTMSGFYCFRVDTERFTYIMRLDPKCGTYNMYCYCYWKEMFEDYFEQANSGVRFVDTDFNTKFRANNGGYVKVTESDGRSFTFNVLYVDKYHCLLGCKYYNILELANDEAKTGAKIAPVEI